MEKTPAGDHRTGAAPGSRRVLLLLCTGNYYRSRFAEELWNHLECGAEPCRWHAESRGLSVASGFPTLGPISPHALRALKARGIGRDDPFRSPIQVTTEDFAAAGHIVAMSESEHRGMVQALFPEWVEKIEYWDVEDIEWCPIEVAMETLASRVSALHARLCRPSTPPAP